MFQDSITDAKSFNSLKNKTFKKWFSKYWQQAHRKNSIIEHAFWMQNSEVFFNRKDTIEEESLGYFYDSLGVYDGALFLQKTNAKEIVVISTAIPVSKKGAKYAKFIVKNGKLYIKFQSVLNKVFDINAVGTETASYFGLSILLKHYKEVKFFNRSFLNVYEFYFKPYFCESEKDVLIWFDEKFNLVRLEGFGGGFLLDKQFE